MDTGELRRVLDRPGPFATVHLAASRDRENADHELELRRRAARRELADDGAGADTLAALDDVVRNAPPAVGRAGWLLVAAGGEGRAGPTAAGRRELGWDRGDIERAVADLAAERARAEHDALVERFRAELASDDGLAVQGLAKATEAPREHNAAAVVLGALPDATVWTSTNPWTLALTEDELRATGAEHTVEAQADEALPAAALLVGAELTSTDKPVADGIGVLLRHTWNTCSFHVDHGRRGEAAAHRTGVRTRG